MKRHRPDTNQKKIVQALRDIGAVVFLIGRPFDLLVGFRGELFLLEVKNPTGRNKLGASQEADILSLSLVGVEVRVVRSVEEALEVCNGTRQA
jgi:hypothetical protein